MTAIISGDSMENEEISTAQLKTSWAISPEWFQKNSRALLPVVREYLCPKCAGNLAKKKKNNSTDAVMSAIHNCCSRSPDFINDRLPVLESIFRLFLANGNQPLGVEELGRQLIELRSGDSYRTSPEILSRILKNDTYYGLQEVSA